jgi:hypothetical protein
MKFKLQPLLWGLVLSLGFHSQSAVSDEALKFSSAEDSLAWSASYERQVVMLGEPDHWIDEKYEYQLLLIEDLLKNGFKTIAFERGRTYMEVVNRYIQSGDEAHLREAHKLLSFRHPSRPTPIPNEGIVADIPSDRMLAYIQWMDRTWAEFFRKLRALRETYEFEVVGFDVDLAPEGAYLPLLKILEEKPHSEELAALLADLNRAPTLSTSEELELLKGIQTRVTAAKFQDLLQDDHAWVMVLTRQLYESMFFASVALNNPTHEALMASFAKREETMFRNMDEFIASGKKLILVGHNAHFSNNSDEYQRVWEVDGVEHLEAMWKVLGSHLEKNYAGNVFTVFMLYDQGRHVMGRECDEFPCRIESLEGTVEASLAKLFSASTFLSMEHLYNLLGADKDAELDWRENGIVRIRGRLHTQADMVFFVPRVDAKLID